MKLTDLKISDRLATGLVVVFVLSVLSTEFAATKVSEDKRDASVPLAFVLASITAEPAAAAAQSLKGKALQRVQSVAVFKQAHDTDRQLAAMSAIPAVEERNNCKFERING